MIKILQLFLKFFIFFLFIEQKGILYSRVLVSSTESPTISIVNIGSLLIIHPGLYFPLFRVFEFLILFIYLLDDRFELLYTTDGICDILTVFLCYLSFIRIDQHKHCFWVLLFYCFYLWKHVWLNENYCEFIFLLSNAVI